MKDATERQLMRAYELIEAGKLDEARAILEPILLSDKNNPDAWWVYAHAVTDAPSARKALDSVLRLDPEYPGAQELRAQLDEIGKPSSVGVSSSQNIRSEAEFDAPAAPRRAADFAGESTPAAETRRNWVPIAGLVAVLAIIVVIVLLLRPFGQPAESTATPESTIIAVVPTDSVAQAATDEASPSVEDTEDASSSGSDMSFDIINQTMSNFQMVENSMGIVETSVGETLLVQICSAPGVELRTTLPAALLSLSNAAVFSGVSSDFIGVQMVDCANGSVVLRTVVSSLTDAQAFANGGIDASTYQARWLSL